MESILHEIEDIDAGIFEESVKHWNSIAKPLHGLGKLEEMISRIAAIQRNVIPRIDKKTIIIMCADNGIVEEGVSQTGQEVTAIVTKNFTTGDTSVNKMAKHVNAGIIPVDIGVNADFCASIPLHHAKVAKGTRNFRKADAMTKEEALKAIQIGMDLVQRCKREGTQIIGTGEMGIGNTTTSAAMASVLLNLPVGEVTGRGAGLSGEGLKNKIKVISDGILKRKPRADDPLDVLCKLGGLDIAGLVGVFLGGARYQVPVCLDGLITSVAALAAKRICPKTTQYMLASHLSKEPAGKKIMEELCLRPVIDANLALGEGTGACLLFGMLDTAMCVYENRTTFADIQIDDYREME